ncbi:hypothetical protein Micbo1qcDRAFT_178090 [Microdochium bolleyi]|uniref:Uncharacterized protein n=1 Tax=Microdochium bolleyi TaxID=196109 RepID=A0A136IU93_9PEZI|nr:hypothetical protein Micbo1qcDRAFT_178090 [Microdochium bolleyi]
MYSKTVALFLLAATGALASPVAPAAPAAPIAARAVDPDLRIINTNTLPNGDVVEIWGRTPEAHARAVAEEAARTLDARANSCASGTITPKCDSKNGGGSSNCLSLISLLQQFPTQSLNGGTQVCYTGTGEPCCTKSNRAISNLQYGDFTANAQTMYQTCPGSSGVSGKMFGVNFFAGNCGNQCMNNGHNCA